MCGVNIDRLRASLMAAVQETTRAHDRIFILEASIKELKNALLVAENNNRRDRRRGRLLYGC